MKKIIPAVLFLTLVIACNSEEKPVADDDINAATLFLQATLKRNFPEARKYMLSDSLNTMYMDQTQRMQTTVEDRQGLFDASIRIHKRDALNDSTSTIIYSNSYVNDEDTLLLVKKDGRWLVDLKYLFGYHRDTMNAKTAAPAIDTIIK